MKTTRPVSSSSIICDICGVSCENMTLYKAHFQAQHQGSAALPLYNAPPSHLPTARATTFNRHDASHTGQSSLFLLSHDRTSQDVLERNDAARSRQLYGSPGQISISDGMGVPSNTFLGAPGTASIFTALSKGDNIGLYSLAGGSNFSRPAVRSPVAHGSEPDSSVVKSTANEKHYFLPQENRSYQLPEEERASTNGPRNQGTLLPSYPGMVEGSHFEPSRIAPSPAVFAVAKQQAANYYGARFREPAQIGHQSYPGAQVSKTDKKPALKCDLCNAELKNEQNLKRHISVVHGSKQAFGCSSCTASFSSRGSLKVHQHSAHGLESPSYSTGSSPRTARRGSQAGASKTIQKSYTCPLCPDSFKWKGNLKRHKQLVHDKIKPFTCNVCYAKFGTKSNMRVHMITHEKPIQ